MVTLTAPRIAPRVKSGLPSPTFSDSEGLINEVDIKKSINNVLYTYVKSKDGRRRLRMDFTTTRMKAEEIWQFYKEFVADELVIEDHLGNTWHGYFAVNPIDLESLNAHGKDADPVGEMVQFSLEFEATKQ